MQLPLDDIVEVMRRCVNDKFSRNAIHRCLKRHGLSQLPGPNTFAPLICLVRQSFFNPFAKNFHFNTPVNPERSTGPALFVGGWALAQLWMFWVAPLIGGVLGGVIYRWLSDQPTGVVEGQA